MSDKHDEHHDHHDEHGGHAHVQGPNISRRQFVIGVMSVGAAAAGLTMISPLLNYDPLALEVKTIAPGDILVYGDGPNAGKPILATDLQDWQALRAFPSSNGTVKNSLDNNLQLMKLPSAQLAAPTVFKAPLNTFQLQHAGGPSGPIDWTQQGIVVYSAVCTHLGCLIDAKIDKRNDGSPYVLCPCHGSEYDPLAGMKVVHPPAPRPVPQLPIKIDEKGQIVVQGFFAGPVGAA